MSRQILDAEAHPRAHHLRDRLEEVLRTRRGDARELVEAERQVSQISQEIDQARSSLAGMRGQSAYSRITVGYETAQPVGNAFLRPIMGMLGSFGGILGSVIAALIVLGTVALPIAVGAGKWANRRFGGFEGASTNWPLCELSFPLAKLRWSGQVTATGEDRKWTWIPV